MDLYGASLEDAISAYAKQFGTNKEPGVTERLLYAILGQMCKANEQLEKIISKLEPEAEE